MVTNGYIKIDLKEGLWIEIIDTYLSSQKYLLHLTLQGL